MIKINIEYCEKWNYKPEFDRVSKTILSFKKNVNIIGNSNPPRTGSFEVSINDKLIYSKLDSGGFPESSEIYSWFHWIRCKLLNWNIIRYILNGTWRYKKYKT